MLQKRRLAYAGLACCIGAAPGAFADNHDEEEEIPFDVAEIFFELNDTDGDLGIHALIDGDAWKRLTIEDRRERQQLKIQVKGRLRQQGLTEIFFESAEPPFDELAPEEFFRRFHAGIYEIEARTLGGEELESETELTHRMPAPPEPTVNEVPMAQQCDDEEPGYDAPAFVSGPIVIRWPAVTQTHPSIGSPQGSGDIEIFNYEVVVEAELDELAGPDGEAFVSVFSVVLPPDVTEMTVPAEFLALTDSFKYELLVREASFNQTAVESCFLLAGD